MVRVYHPCSVTNVKEMVLRSKLDFQVFNSCVLSRLFDATRLPSPKYSSTFSLYRLFGKQKISKRILNTINVLRGIYWKIEKKIR